MKLHEHIVRHVRTHGEKVVTHVKKHHKKYLVGAGILSWMAIYKIIGIMLLFFGMANMWGGTIGADYYDAEFYAQQEANKISISNDINTGNMPIGDNLTGNSGQKNNISWEE
jgi:hypothetical protein